MSIKACLSSAKTGGRDDWGTPQWLFDAWDMEFGFTLDPCASRENAKCKRYFSVDDNGLLQSWKDERVFCNPPYSDADSWVKKAWIERNDAVLSVLLLPARTDTSRYRRFIDGFAEVRLLKGRIKFEGAKHGAPFPSMLVVYRRPVLTQRRQ